MSIETATRQECIEAISKYEQIGQIDKVNRYKERLCEIYDFEQKFMNTPAMRSNNAH